jgi:hypothetical protein
MNFRDPSSLFGHTDVQDKPPVPGWNFPLKHALHSLASSAAW